MQEQRAASDVLVKRLLSQTNEQADTKEHIRRSGWIDVDVVVVVVLSSRWLWR